MPFDNDFEDLFDDFSFFNGKLVRRLQKEMDEAFKNIRSGKLRGSWERREINEPGVKGFIMVGHFGTDKALEPFDPLRPQRRRPLPENPFELSKREAKEAREPLTDIFEEENATKIYVELPGEDEKGIHLNIAGGSIEIKARNFYKTVDLTQKDIAKEAVTTKYKNGVLEITIPRDKSLRKQDKANKRNV